MDKAKLENAIVQKGPVYYVETIYLTPQQLAGRYGVQVKTLQHWRWRTRKGKGYGPKWEEIPPQPLRKKFMTYVITLIMYWLGKKQH